MKENNINISASNDKNISLGKNIISANPFDQALSKFETRVQSIGELGINRENCIGRLKSLKPHFDSLSEIFKHQRKDILSSFESTKYHKAFKGNLGKFADTVQNDQLLTKEQKDLNPDHCSDKEIVDYTREAINGIFKIYGRVGTVNTNVLTQNRYNGQAQNSLLQSVISGIFSIINRVKTTDSIDSVKGDITSFLEQSFSTASTVLNNMNNISGSFLSQSFRDALKDEDVAPFIKNATSYLLYLKNACNELKEKKGFNDKYFTDIAGQIKELNDSVDSYISNKLGFCNSILENLKSHDEIIRGKANEMEDNVMKNQEISDIKNYLADNNIMKKIVRHQVIDKIKDPISLLDEIENIKSTLTDECNTSVVGAYGSDNEILSMEIFNNNNRFKINKQEYESIMSTLDSYSKTIDQIITGEKSRTELVNYFNDMPQKINDFKDYMRLTLNSPLINKSKDILEEFQKLDSIRVRNTSTYMKFLPFVFYAVDEASRVTKVSTQKREIDSSIKEFVEAANSYDGFKNIALQFREMRNIINDINPKKSPFGQIKSINKDSSEFDTSDSKSGISDQDIINDKY